jgi:hypothetical protein
MLAIRLSGAPLQVESSASLQQFKTQEFPYNAYSVSHGSLSNNCFN